MYDPADPKFRKVLNHGFVYLLDSMGDDTAITNAARISYGVGTKAVREDRGLIRYLMRHHHWSPFEMAEVKYHVRLPIFVMRQLIRHKANLNEYSARYSVVRDEFYVPDPEFIQPQDGDNRQGRAGSIGETSTNGVQWLLRNSNEHAYDIYRLLLNERTGRDANHPDELVYDPYSQDDPLLDPAFPGISRELARTVLPVAYYTEVYWKQNLRDLLHLLNLRMDSHAQQEIRVFAQAMYDLIQPSFPLVFEAWTDYLHEAVSLSRMEVMLLRDLLHGNTTIDVVDAEQYDMSKRELREFVQRFTLGDK